MSSPDLPTPSTPPDPLVDDSDQVEPSLPAACFQKALEDLKAMAQTPGRRESLLCQMHSYLHVAYGGVEASL
ncbi:hypothetical protein H6F76_00510 [Leptolyngbya sp. FACHB-321]|uniref:hypothetical protein n=1 Tax=Leptolyngbya sp. FACHB-321 TaxID=2692807 RepID=UPI00168754AD|nr:hypothetical protein [Leptolyngbya sp. FACHB-321]MBD2033547.1 hypothetical protein [Leptolyngbya sp. FACHB-321]